MGPRFFIGDLLPNVEDWEMAASGNMPSVTLL
jgi:hypothetical protein